MKSLVQRFARLEPRVKNTVYAFVIFSAGALVLFGILRGGSKELRASAPEDSLAFFEVRDAGGLLRAMTKNSGGLRVRDFSMFDGMNIAVAVSGFETSEQELTGEQSILNLRLKFAAIVETNGWSWQTKRFLEGPLNELISKEFGRGAERSSKAFDYGTLSIWKAADGRETYAFTDGSRVLFGNDEPFLLRCAAAARGKIRTLIEEPELKSFYDRSTDRSVLGYLSKRAITKFAGVAGVSAAVSGSDSGGMRDFISRLVPQLLDNSVESMFWTAKPYEDGIHDQIFINTKKEVSEVLIETMKTGSQNGNDLLRFVPENTSSLTKYNTRSPRIAYRSVILVAGKAVDPVSANLLDVFSRALLGSYGITDPEMFLDSVEGEIITLELNDPDQSSAAIARVKNKEQVLESLTEGIGRNERNDPAGHGEYWDGGNGYAAAFADGILITGDKRAVDECMKSRGLSASIQKSDAFSWFAKKGITVNTIAVDEGEYEFLFDRDEQKGSRTKSLYYSGTDFGGGQISRTYGSKYGLLGSLLARISGE